MNMNDMYKNFDTQKIINEFPALKQKVWDKSLVYLDSAASMQKPKDVIHLDKKNNITERENKVKGKTMKNKIVVTELGNKVLNYLDDKFHDIIYNKTKTKINKLLANEYE